MGGCRCSYKSCRSATKTTENLHFFHYPIKSRERCAIWIRNAGKTEFADLPDYQLRNKVICGLHFEDRYFANIEKRRLVHNAVPTLDGNVDSIDDDTPYDKEVEILPTSSDGSSFTLLTDNLNISSKNHSRNKFQNGNVVYVNAPDEPEVYTIDPSFFNQDTYDNDLVINSASPEGCFDETEHEFKQEYQEEEECMMIYDKPQVSQAKIPNKPVHLFLEDDFDFEDKDDVEMTHVSQKPRKIQEIRNQPVQVIKPSVKVIKTEYNLKPMGTAEKVKTPEKGSNAVRLNKQTLLRILKGQLPDSVLGLVSLHLNKRHNALTPEELKYAAVMKKLPYPSKLVLNTNGWYIP